MKLSKDRAVLIPNETEELTNGRTNRLNIVASGKTTCGEFLDACVLTGICGLGLGRICHDFAVFKKVVQSILTI